MEVDGDDDAAVIRDIPSDETRKRVTRLYGAVDLDEAYPPTIVEETRGITAPSPVIGSMLQRYRIGDVLGQGGMGEVLSARDEQIGRPVAIKRLRVENPSPEVLARFLREARIMVSVLAAHRRLVRLWVLALLTVIATLAPWLLELAGVFESRMSVIGNSIVLETAATTLDPKATLAGLFIYIVALIHLAALIARLVDDDRRKVRRAMQLQSWQLRQLVPRVASRPPRDG